MKFEELKLLPQILKSLKEENYIEPTEIQAKAIPLILERKDVLGSAQTGTGKTAAFAIPIIQHLVNDQKKIAGKRKIEVLTLTPTRELAMQVGESFSTYGKYTKIKNTVVFGGVSQGAQTNALKRGVDILVATPGRLIDLMEQGFISLANVRYFVLDEVDRMLDMGFIHDIKKVIAKLPNKRQTLFFSATMPPSIVTLSHQLLINPQKIAINTNFSTADTVQQYLYTTNRADKKELLLHILKKIEIEQVLIFVRTKYGSDGLVTKLKREKIECAAIHGNKSQSQRQRALKQFKDGEIKILVATDVASRGIDIDKLRYVINYDIPNEPESYVHRIGRCGRAGEEGIAISMCAAEENAYILDIEKLIKQKIEIVGDNPFPQISKPEKITEKKGREKQKSQQEFFAKRNKKKDSQNSEFRKKKR